MKIFSLLFLLSFSAFASIDCEKHPIYCHIKAVAPWLKYNKAMELSNKFYKYSKRYGTDPHVSVAIARQESTFNQNNHRKQGIIQFFDNDKKWRYVEGYSDICMFQFHVDTIINEEMSPIQLKTDNGYCIEQHFKLLAKKMRVCKKLGVPKKESWSCYHSYTPRLRKRYFEDVSRYL